MGVNINVNVDVLAKKRTREDLIDYAKENSDKTVYLQYPKGHFDFLDGEVITYEEVVPGEVIIQSSYKDSHVEVRYNYQDDISSPALSECPAVFREVIYEAIMVFRGAVLMRLYDEGYLFSKQNTDKSTKPREKADKGGSESVPARRSWIPQKLVSDGIKKSHHAQPKYRVFCPGHFRYKGTPRQTFVRPHTRWNNLPIGDEKTELFYL